MDLKTFKAVAVRRFDRCLMLMTTSKNTEYTRGGDKLHNFKEAGKLQDITPERALWGMMTKQLVSLKDMLTDLDEGRLPAETTLSEKTTDVVNYLVLLEALYLERIRNVKK